MKTGTCSVPASDTDSDVTSFFVRLADDGSVEYCVTAGWYTLPDEWLPSVVWDE